MHTHRRSRTLQSGAAHYGSGDGLATHAAYTLGWPGDPDAEQSRRRTDATPLGIHKDCALHALGGGVS